MNRPLFRAAPTRLLALTALLALLLALSGCSSEQGSTAENAPAAAPVAITLYSGQHESLAQRLAEAFEADSGIQVRLRAGKDGELANQIIEEGARSRADVFISEEPGPVGDLARRGLLRPVPEATLARSASRFVPSDGGWLPWAARSRVIYYNPSLIAEDELPETLLDLMDEKWAGRFAYAPSGAFRSTTAYLINTIGEERALEWLVALRENGINEQKNGKVRDSVEAGQHAFGLSNHYYWYIMARNRGGESELNSRVHFLNREDAGALMLASGAGVLASSSHPDEAQQFLDWLISPEGGQRIVAEDSPQFPLAEGVESSYGLPPIRDLVFPEFDQAELNNVDEASELLKRAGII